MNVIVNFFLITIIASFAGLLYILQDGEGNDWCRLFNELYWMYSPNLDGLEFDHTDYPWRQKLRDHYLIIKQEFLEYTRSNNLARYDSIDPVQTGIDSAVQPHIPWEVLILKMFGRTTQKITYFPKTYALLSNLSGCTVTLAMFSVLPPGTLFFVTQFWKQLMHLSNNAPGKHLPIHWGPYKGVMRYHLCLLAPKNYKKSVLMINNKKYHWREGEDVLFDDTYTHSVKNSSPTESRVVLFLDIQKDFHNFIPNMVNNFFLTFSRFHARITSVTRNQDAMDLTKGKY